MSIEIVSKGFGVAELRAGVEGSVYLPGEAGYEAASQGWNLVVSQSPKVIVDVETTGDIQAAVRYARANGLPVGVMATGHGTPRACDGLLIRMVRMTGVRVDPEARLARIQGGALVKDVHAASATYGLTMLGGSTCEVGVVGYTLGGGYGLMQRKHGLAVDRVRGAKMVAPDGELLTLSETENAELFWAIRGGGGAFGVIVEITMELVAQATIYGGATVYPADDAAAIARAWARWTRGLPEEIVSTLLIMNLPPLPTIPAPLRGRAVVMINGCVCGDLEGAADLVRPMRDLGVPLLDTWGLMPVAASDCIFNDPTAPMPAMISGALLRGLDDAVVDRLMAAVGPIHEMPQVMVQVRHVGGAMARADRACGPIGEGREAEYLAYAIGVPNPFCSAAALHDHAEGLFGALGSAVLRRGPLNFLGEGSVCSERVRGAYCDEAHARLRAAKRAVDPGNAFRYASVGIE